MMFCFLKNFDFSPTNNNGGEKEEFIFYHHRHHFGNRFQWKKILPHFFFAFCFLHHYTHRERKNVNMIHGDNFKLN